MSERIPVTDFEVWIRTACFRVPSADCHDLAETAWLHQQERIAKLLKMQEALIEWIQEDGFFSREAILEIAEREMKEEGE